MKRALDFDVILAANDQRLYCEAYVVCRQHMPNGTVSTVLRDDTPVGHCLSHLLWISSSLNMIHVDISHDTFISWLGDP